MSVLPPLHSGVSLYTAGLLSGFARKKSSFELVVVTNKSAHQKSQRVNGMRFLKTWSRGYKYFFQILSAVIKEKPDIAHFQHEFFLFGGMISAALFPVLLLFMRFLRVKTVVTMHGVISKSAANNEFAEAFFVPKNYFLLRVGLGSLTTIICKLANTMIVHSHSAKNALTHDYQINPTKIRVVPHGVGLWNSENRTPPENNILFFGNITPSKGLENLISAFEQVKVPNSKLIIAGGPHPRGLAYFQKINDVIQGSKKSEEIICTGYVPDEQIHQLFEKAQATVFPYTFSVSCSGGLSFALQHQKPAIVTSLPSFTEIIVDGANGIVVPPNDNTALAKAIERLLLDKHLRDELTRGIAKTCERLNWPEIASENIKCYKQLSW